MLDIISLPLECIVQLLQVYTARMCTSANTSRGARRARRLVPGEDIVVVAIDRVILTASYVAIINKVIFIFIQLYVIIVDKVFA